MFQAGVQQIEMMNRTQVEIVEVGPRDGLQNEAAIISVEDKVELVDALSEAGFGRIEACSFVSPKWVPQMASSGEVLAAIRRCPRVRYMALVPNRVGLNRALAAGVDEVAVFVSASEGFSRANVNASVDESLQRLEPVAKAAKDSGLPVRGYVSSAISCPYDGPTDLQALRGVASTLLGFGCDEISLGDTIGAGTPETVSRMLRVMTDHVPAAKLAGHYHDTKGLAIDNIAASLEFGLRVFDASIGGLGGCPFAPGSAGNVDTVAVHEMLTKRGYSTGLDDVKLGRAQRIARRLKDEKNR